MKLESVFTLGQQAPPPHPPPPKMFVGWRGLHVAEGGRAPSPLGNPGVIPPFDPTVRLRMTKDIQLMSYDLMAYFHPAVRADKNKWRIMHGYNVAMNNGTGFDEPGDPRADFVNGRDLFSSWPEYDKMQRTFCGSFITGRLEGNVIWCQPGVDAIDARGFSYVPGTPEAAAMLQNIIEKRWYSYAVAETLTGTFKVRGQWGDGFAVFPFILDRPVSFLARFFVAWNELFPPDPLKIYTPIGLMASFYRLVRKFLPVFHL